MKALQRLTAGFIPAFLILSTGLSSPDASGAPRVVPGEVAAEKATKLTSEIKWYENLNQAQAQAQRDGKLIFWMHMLGNLSGTT
jgi:hypothetical protein